METKVCECCGRELPLDQFIKRSFGMSHICKKCNGERIKEARERKKGAKNLEQELEHARQMRLHEFTPRELMEELASRGYKGKLTYTHVEEINIENF